MANNKIKLASGEVLMDLTGDTVNPDVLVEGYTAHDKAGNPIVGRMSSAKDEVHIGPEEPAGGEALWVDTDEDVPIPEGGLQMVKVWENASATSAFTAQTITIPAGYDAVLIESYGAAPTFIGYGDGNYMMTYYNVSVALRFCNFNTNNSLVFNNVVGPAGVSNDYAVPRDIYGIKGVRY